MNKNKNQVTSVTVSSPKQIKKVLGNNDDDKKENNAIDQENLKKYSGDISNSKKNLVDDEVEVSQKSLFQKKENINTGGVNRNNSVRKYSVFLESPVLERKYSGLFNGEENNILEKIISDIFDNDDESLMDGSNNKNNNNNKRVSNRRSTLLGGIQGVERQDSNIFNEEENQFLKQMIMDIKDMSFNSLKGLSRESTNKEGINEYIENNNENEDNSEDEVDEYMNENIDILHNEPSFIQKHIKFLEDKRVIQWMKENKEYKEKIINEVVDGLNNGNIKYGKIDSYIKSENLREEIKIAFITNEMNHLKVKLDVDKLMENNDIKSIQDAMLMNIDEMDKIKNYNKCKLHKDFVNQYNRLQEKFIAVNNAQEEKRLMDSFLRGVMIKFSELKSNPNYAELFNNNNIEEEDVSLENKLEIKRTIITIMTNKLKLEEVLYNISNMNIRLEIEEKILMCNEDQIQKINQMEKQLDELESKFINDNTENSSNELKDKMTEFLRKCIEQIVVNNNNRYQIETNNVLIKIYQKYHEKLEVFNILSSNIPKFKDKYCNLLNRFVHAGDSINPTINQRYVNYKTIFHNEASTNKDQDFAEVIVALIKMGGNVSLKDNVGKTPFDYIENNSKLDEVYECLNRHLAKTTAESAVGLRIMRGMLEIEMTSKNNLENLEKYFDAVMNYVKRNKNEKSYEEMEDILSIHIWHEENPYIRNEKEKYFSGLKKECKKKIDEIQKFFNKNGLDETGFTPDNKKWKTDDTEENTKYNEYLKKIDEAVDDLQTINTYLLEKSSVRFTVEKNTIKNEIEIINYNTFSEAINRCMEKDIENFLMEYPSQVLMTLNNNNDILEEIIDQKNMRLLETLSKKGRDLNSFMKDDKLPLERAVQNNNVYFVKEMINLGASMENETKSGHKIIDLIKEKMPNLYNELNNKK